MELVLAVIFVALVFEYINGFHDTANSIATVVSTKVLTPRQAIVLAAVTNLLGALMGFAVAKTVSSGLVEAKFVTQHTIIAAMLGGIVWNLITWWLGLPSSSTHAMVGGLCGATMASAGSLWQSSLIWSQADGKHWWEHKGLLYKVVIPMLTSPICGFLVGMIVMGTLYVLLRNWRPVTVGRTFGRMQIVSAAYMGWSHGTNDAQKTMGIIALALAAATTAGTFDNVPRWASFLYQPDTTPAVYSAEMRLAEMHLEGKGVPQDTRAAVGLLERASKGKNAEASFTLGSMYLEGRSVKQNDTKAADYFERAAKLNHPAAQTNFAALLQSGRGVEKADPAAAAKLLAAATNAAPKKFALASPKWKDAPTNATEAVTWFQAKADKNNANAQVSLGVAYATGKGVTADEKKAVELFEKAAARNNPDALFNLGLFTLLGKSIAKDEAKAAQHFRAAAAVEGIQAWIKVICALIMAAGTAAGGWKIIKTLGHKMVKLQPVHGFAAETTAASVLAFAAHFGMPVSTTHAITTSIMGVGCAKNFNALKFKVVKRILWAWVLTLPASALMAWLFLRFMQVVGWAPTPP